MTQEQDSLSFTPSQELLDAWISTVRNSTGFDKAGLRWLAQVAAKWGADQELKACCVHILALYGDTSYGKMRSDELMRMRRPKPLSLKQQALNDVHEILKSPQSPTCSDFDRIIAALKQLPGEE